MATPFPGPLLKVKQSQKHIECLKQVMAAYAARVKFGFRKADISETDLVSWTLVFSEPPPEGVSPLIGDSIHNLRSALDLMICDVARLRGEGTDHLAFPFAMDEHRLDKEINKPKPCSPRQPHRRPCEG